MGDIGGLALNEAQTAHALAMVRTVQGEGLPQRAAVIVMETAIVESTLQIYANPNVAESMDIAHEAEGDDHASVGPLQQQVPSWGTAADCMNPQQATIKFLHGAGNNPGLTTLPPYRFRFVGFGRAKSWEQIPTGAAAQAVQVSAFPDRYQQQEAHAVALAIQLWHTDRPSQTPTLPEGDEDMPMIFTNADKTALPVLAIGNQRIPLRSPVSATNLTKAGVATVPLGDVDYTVVRSGR